MREILINLVSNAFGPGLKGVSENSWRHLQAFSKKLVLRNISPKDAAKEISGLVALSPKDYITLVALDDYA